MSELAYKGYTGSVELSLDDMCYYGKILKIKSLLMYEGNTLGELQNAFMETVDAYLDLCDRRNEMPEIPRYG